MLTIFITLNTKKRGKRDKKGKEIVFCFVCLKEEWPEEEKNSPSDKCSYCSLPNARCLLY